MENYDHKNIERKWQDKWETDGIYSVPDDISGKENFYQLVEFSYPSGNLHVGHWYAFSVPDIFARYKRMQGFNVLYPMGFDAFGLPAENAAIKLGADPKVWTIEQMEKMRVQLRTMGAMFPWEREVVTCDPEYYRWTQWMFNQFLKNDLVYRAITKVNWCPKDQTILANEQVVDGKCERCGSEVVQRDQPQWMLRITKYADRLIDDLDKLDWPSAIKESQKNWIGRSEGSEISFNLKVESDVVSEAFKFRPELVELIKKGEKNVTFRMEPKNVSVGDTISLIDWAEGKSENQKEFDKAKITKISQFKLNELPLDYPGHERDISFESRLARYKEYYGDHITNESVVYVYEFELMSIRIFTTRADTLFGVTYVVLAPEHKILESLKDKISNWDEVEQYISETKKKSELDRQQSKDKTGVELKGIKAINPVNGEEVPVWIADYVLVGYGTGAVMAVPAHDERDFLFAKKYNLPIKDVVSKQWVLTGEDAEQEDAEILEREVVDPIIRDKDGNFYFINEKGKVHFAGGGLDGSETEEEALKREVIEETGFTDFEIIKLKIPYLSLRGFRHGKNKNQRSIGTAYEVVLSSTNRIRSEVEERGNELVVVKKEEVLKTLSWEHHKYLFEKYLQGDSAFIEDGVLFNSTQFDGLTSEEARTKITEFVGGKIVKNYRLRDWGISRQRYWGCPIPIVYDPEGNAHAVPDEHLPWILPTDVDHTPDGTAPLARSKELFERTEKIFGTGWKPEVETMDTFVDSSWYFYRYLDNKNEKEFSAMDKMDAWMPIDLYMGGAEHTTMHLLYSRFWTKALYDIGFVKDQEAYKIRRNRGLILGPDGEKMSKSRGNVINPDEIVERLGADTVRMYLAFMGPYGITTNYPWDPNGVVGVRRFLERVWKIKEKIDVEKKVCKTDPLVHKTIKGVTEDIEEFKFNTAIAKMMILLNALEKEEKIVSGSYNILLRLLAPFAPHITEELYQKLTADSLDLKAGSIHLSDWPKFDESLTVDEIVNVAVSFNGKGRGVIEMNKDSTEEEVIKSIFDSEKFAKYIENKDSIKKVIFVQNRIINIITE